MSSTNSLPVVNQSDSVFSPVFVPQEFYSSAKQILCWGVFSQHLEIVRDSSKSIGDKFFHGVLATIEFLPILSQIASLIEAIAFKLLGCCKSGSGSNTIEQQSQELKIKLGIQKHFFDVECEFFATNLHPKSQVAHTVLIAHRESLQNVYEEIKKLKVDLSEYNEKLEKIDETLIIHFDFHSMKSIKNNTQAPNYPDAKSLGWVNTCRVEDSLGVYGRPSYAALQSVVDVVFKKPEFDSVYVLDSGEITASGIKHNIPPRGSMLVVRACSLDYFTKELDEKLIAEARSKGYKDVYFYDKNSSERLFILAFPFVSNDLSYTVRDIVA